MGMLEIKRKNMELIFDSIVDGNKTLSAISKGTGISKMTVCELTQLLIKNKIISKHTEPENKRGRRSNIYTLHNKMHCMYIEESSLNFSCISIDIQGDVVQRLVYEKRQNANIEEVVTSMFQDLRRTRAFGRFCTCVFVVCTDDTLKYFPKNIVRTTKERLILSGMCDSKKMLLFELDNKVIISAYGHLHYPNKIFTIHQIRKMLRFDKTYRYNKDVYFGIFEALKMHTIKNLRAKINTIE